MHRLRTVTYLDVSAVAGHHAMPAALLLLLLCYCYKWLHFIVCKIWTESDTHEKKCHKAFQMVKSDQNCHLRNHLSEKKT